MPFDEKLKLDVVTLKVLTGVLSWIEVYQSGMDKEYPDREHCSDSEMIKSYLEERIANIKKL